MWGMQAIRGEFADAGGLREVVDIKEEELLDLATQLRIRDKELEEGRARMAVLKARTDQMLGEVQRIAEVERRLVVAQNNEAKLQEAMEALEDDLDRLHRENANLKRSIRQARGPGGDITPGKPGAFRHGPDALPDDMAQREMASEHGHGYGPAGQVVALQHAIQALRGENTRLRSEAARRGVSVLPSLPVPDRNAAATITALTMTAVRLVHVCRHARETRWAFFYVIGWGHACRRSRRRPPGHEWLP